MSQQMLNTKMMQTLVDKLSLAGLDRQLKCIKRGHEGRGEAIMSAHWVLMVSKRRTVLLT